MVWSAKDEGESEGRPVTGRIGVAEQLNITPRENEQTSLWSDRARERLSKRLEAGKADDDGND
jgi:hypothetical protein